jgi:hypothetical protein
MSLEARIAGLEARVAALEGAKGNGAADGTAAAGAIADDATLDGPYGDPVVKNDPKRWIEGGGASHKGRKMSECPPAYLTALAGLFEWVAKQAEEKGETYTPKGGGDPRPVAPLRRKDAALARGHAKRNAEAKPPAKPSDDGDGLEEIPF